MMTRIVIEYASGMQMIFGMMREEWELPDFLINPETRTKVVFYKRLRNGNRVYRQEISE